jgi:hypothetical protein
MSQPFNSIYVICCDMCYIQDDAADDDDDDDDDSDGADDADDDVVTHSRDVPASAWPLGSHLDSRAARTCEAILPTVTSMQPRRPR